MLWSYCPAIITIMASFDERYAFIADWYDPNAALMRKYQLLYYSKDSTVEMVGFVGC